MKTPLFHVFALLLFGVGATLSVHAQSDGLPRGAIQLPYIRYEAEAANLGSGASLQQSPQFIQSDIASEACVERIVDLDARTGIVFYPEPPIGDKRLALLILCAASLIAKRE